MAADEKCPGFLCANDAADDGGLCRHCSALANLKERVARESVAADRARIAQAIQDELDSEIEGGSTRIVLLLERLLRVVEGG